MTGCDDRRVDDGGDRDEDDRDDDDDCDDENNCEDGGCDDTDCDDDGCDGGVRNEVDCIVVLVVSSSEDNTSKTAKSRYLFRYLLLYDEFSKSNPVQMCTKQWRTTTYTKYLEIDEHRRWNS